MNLPSRLSCGRLLLTSTAMFVLSNDDFVLSTSALWVLVIWKIRRWAASQRKISRLPSALNLSTGSRFRSVGASVARSARDSKTTKRPSPLTSPTKAFTSARPGVGLATGAAEVIWTTNGSGVGVAVGVGVGVCAAAQVAIRQSSAKLKPDRRKE